MAIRDKTKTGKNRFIQDRDKGVSIGIDLPFKRGNRNDGWFATTKTTIAAIKNNIRNFIKTEKGERIMNPSLGVSLKKYLFDPIDEDKSISIKNEIINSFKQWLPTVEINDIIIDKQPADGLSGNTIKIKVKFTVSQDPTTLHSVELNLGD